MSLDRNNTEARTEITFGPLLAAFGTAIFLSAALLFVVQPMFTKMVLPRLGGAPAVWSVALVFFQAVLLLGYAYAHLLTRTVPTRIALFIHLAVMAAATLALPLRHRRRLGPAADRGRSAVAGRTVHGLDRHAVLRAVGQWAAAAGLVRPQRPSARQGPVFPLRHEQRRQHARIAQLSVPARAVHPARAADHCMDDRLLCADRADRCLRRRRRGRRARPRAMRRSRRKPGFGRAGEMPPSGWRSRRSPRGY